MARVVDSSEQRRLTGSQADVKSVWRRRRDRIAQINGDNRRYVARSSGCDYERGRPVVSEIECAVRVRSQSTSLPVTKCSKCRW